MRSMSISFLRTAGGFGRLRFCFLPLPLDGDFALRRDDDIVRGVDDGREFAAQCRAGRTGAGGERGEITSPLESDSFSESESELESELESDSAGESDSLSERNSKASKAGGWVTCCKDRRPSQLAAPNQN